jgi:hypothetical protein
MTVEEYVRAGVPAAERAGVLVAEPPGLSRGELLAHLQVELRWLSLRLRAVVERGRARRSVGPPSEHRGLYIADEEIDQLLEEALRGNGPPRPGDAADDAARLRRTIDDELAWAGGHADELPLERITQAFALSREERLALVVALAPSLDAGYEKVYAYANDDITRRRPTVGLALDVLTDDAGEALALRRIFYADAPLVRHALLALGDDGGAAGSLLSRSIEIDGHVAEALLGYGGIDPRLAAVATLEDTAAQGEEGDVVAARLGRVLRQRRDARVYFSGRWHDEMRATVTAAAASAGLRALVLEASALAAAGPATCAHLVRLALRDAVMHGAALYIDGWDGQGDGEHEHSTVRRTVTAALAGHRLPAVIAGAAATPEMPHPRFDLVAEYPAPDFAARRAGWRRETGGSAAGETLAATFRFGLRETRGAARMAESLRAWAGIAPGDGNGVPADAVPADAVPGDDLRLAARLQAQPRLTSLAQKITPSFAWDDIVLPPDRLQQLREIAVQVLYRHVVFDEWGFGRKTSLGRGVNALFAGQSGTGKTMAAEIIAGDLGLDLYKIDLSGLVSKYIGETEKNLAKVFDEASDTSAILFFDEADAVFGKRTEVKDSHDRYANIEVSYLLQKMEEYDGIVVLASNLRSNLDEAFLRRMRAIVEFPFPEEEDRLRIWQRTLQPAVPVAGDVDLAFMARQFRIAGGNIKNIVLLAAFLAAERGEAIAMSHLIRATKREFQKLGRLISETDFADWYGEVRA